MPTALRSDARRNRERIVQAARTAFAESGLDVGVEEIARRAGVGMGTLYRRFPTKESLVHAIFEDRLDALEPVIARALARDNPWDGFAELLTGIVEQQIGDHGFSQMVVLRLGPEAIPPDIRRRVFGPLEQLLARAQERGLARTDVGPRDLPAIVRMAGATAIVDERAADCRRHVALLLDGLSASG